MPEMNISCRSWPVRQPVYPLVPPPKYPKELNKIWYIQYALKTQVYCLWDVTPCSLEDKQQTTWYNIPDDSKLHRHHSKNLKPAHAKSFRVNLILVCSDPT